MAEASIETAAKARAVSEARAHALEWSEEQRRRVEAEVAARVAEVTRAAELARAEAYTESRGVWRGG